MFQVPTGCTKTQGWWKTHGNPDRVKKYDKTWDELSNGPDTYFFSSGSSYFKVLWTPPKEGNAFYILAHQYIAAELNQLTGTSFPEEVMQAFSDATDLFNAASDDTIGDTDREEWINLSKVLDDYNNGLIGPEHCDD